MEEAWFSLKLDERGNVVLLLNGDRIQLGPKEAACNEMCRFLTELDYGECG